MMQTVTSTDGTRIAYERHGDGPPLVLLHGSSATRHSWEALHPHLDDAFTLVAPDRRGRGDSGDADSYGLDREVADLRAVVDAVADDGDDVTVFGHSFGGLVALAAAEALPLERLVLYEPAVLVDGHRDGDVVARMRAHLDRGDRRAAMKHFYREAAGIPAPERLPIWPDDVDFDLVDTVVRENAVVESYALPDSPDVGAETLLLTGDRGPEHLRAAVRELDSRLARSRVVELDGVGHVGTQSAPGQVAEAVRTAGTATTAPR